ncbi:DNA alkylation repair protein [Psychromicrobium sp. YIM B11713]|uniref:DNA alkylation repair protein n=1 Tax=Psychromicrobium sp. YIM B11713 TaxID=3145233 RepID=UPI00374FAC41
MSQIQQELRNAADPLRAPKMQAYMKSSMPYLGVTMPQVRKITTTAVRERPFENAAELLRTAEFFWRAAHYREERYVALALTDVKEVAQNLDFLPLYQEMVRSGAWWDYVDWVAHRIRGLLHAHPGTLAPLLIDWSVHENFWFRRLSIISQLQAKDETDLELLTKVIEVNMADSEFFVRKAIGWALRDYARTDPLWVLNFVDLRSGLLSPLSRREALKHLI